MARLKQRVVERVLAGELTQHLGYGHGEKRGETTEGNRRATEIAVPQDRNGNFEPMLWLKEQKRFVGFDKRIIAMYGRGRRCAKSRESARNPKMIYTTDAIESLHMQFRKVLKNRGYFPSDKTSPIFPNQQ